MIASTHPVIAYYHDGYARMQKVEVEGDDAKSGKEGKHGKGKNDDDDDDFFIGEKSSSGKDISDSSNEALWSLNELEEKLIKEKKVKKNWV